MDGMTTPTAKSARLDFRVTAEQKATIEEAAAIEGRSLTDFSASTLVERAQEIIQRDRRPRVDAVRFDAFVEAANAIGVRAILVHAIDDDVVAFYERFGLTVFPDARRRLYLLTKDARATLLR